MKIYNYKTGKAVFINNVKTDISEETAFVLESSPIFPEEMYKDLGLNRVTFVRDSDETTLKLAGNTQIENFTLKNEQYDFNVTFLLYKGVPFWIFGEYQGQDASILRQFNINQVYIEFKNNTK